MKLAARVAAQLVLCTGLAAAAPVAKAENGKSPDAGAAAADGSAATDSAAATAVEASAAKEKKGEEPEADEEDSRRKNFHVSGYVQPQFGVRYRPQAVPQERTDYSAGDTRLGVIADGHPLDGWSYTLHIVVGGDVVGAVTEDPNADNNGDGQPDNASFLSRAESGIQLERAAVDWDPTEHVGVSLGQMRIPFTVENQIGNTSLMFPNRAAADQVFLRGSDLGALGRLSLRQDKLRVFAGVFNGTDATRPDEENARGPLYAVRADIDPMGRIETGGRDTTRGPLRFGFGAGVIYYPSTTFDSAGFENAKMRDLRASLSARFAVRGFYFQGELLRRQRTDSLSSRPLVATGAYGQASYYIQVKPSIAVSPIARLGWTEEDESFDPRETIWTEAGASLHLRTDKQNPDDLRLTLQYLGERRVTERETAHGAVAQLQLRY